MKFKPFALIRGTAVLIAVSMLLDGGGIDGALAYAVITGIAVCLAILDPCLVVAAELKDDTKV